MNSSVRRGLIIVVFALLGAFALRQLGGPEGLPSVRQKWDEIRQLEEGNATLQRENDYRRDRIKKLESSPSEQELEIRKKLKLLRPGETSFILPEQPKSSSSDPRASDPPTADTEAKPDLDSDSN